MGFKYARCNDGRKLLMERSDISTVRAMFLRTMHEIRQVGVANEYYLDEMWVNKNHICKSCWKRSDGSGGLRVPRGKGGRFMICHDGSGNRSFVPYSKSIFPSK
jgi:hypothetical protein